MGIRYSLLKDYNNKVIKITVAIYNRYFSQRFKNDLNL